MILLILPSRIIIAFISSCANNTWVPPLADMERNPGILGRGYPMRTKIRIIFQTCIIAAPSSLYKLFTPINSYNNSERDKGILPNQIMEDKGMQTQREIDQCKEMPPDELQCRLCMLPDKLYRVHGFLQFSIFRIAHLLLNAPQKETDRRQKNGYFG